MTCPPFRHCVFPRSARRAGGAVVLAAILPGWAAAQTGAIPETPAVPGSAMLQIDEADAALAARLAQAAAPFGKRFAPCAR